MRRKIAIGIFNNFVKIRGAGPKPKHRHRNSYKFPEQRNRTYFPEFSVKEHNNMHPLNRACTYNILLVTSISDSAILLF